MNNSSQPPVPSPRPQTIAPPPTPSSEYAYSNLPPQELPPVTTHEYPGGPLGRAGLETKPRLILLTSVGTLWGFAIGSFLGGQQAGLQYLAENAHRLPTTVQGWYFYHKTKNYRMALGGIKRGAKFAGRTGGLCLMYGAIEAGLDDIRGEADVANSVIAGVTAGTIFSAITRLTRGSFRYSVLFGAAFGLATGGLSDLHRYATGHPPSYVQWLKHKVSKEDQKDH
ncbi:hypothetical protein CLU79DRAFT_700706 [Phycomyces nitens]|nr:hypothetical protein CLU79DRAFT_700706 [Phycomyces nitens]